MEFSSKSAAKENAQQRCQEIQDHLAQALGALGALSSELSDDVDSGLYNRQVCHLDRNWIESL